MLNMKEELAKARAANASDADKPRVALVGQFNSQVKDATHLVFKTGAFGYKITYKVVEQGEAFGREFSESIVVTTKAGIPNTLGFQKFSRRIELFAVDEALSFPGTVDEDAGGLLDMVGKRAVLTLEEEKNPETGKTYSRIAKVSAKKRT